MSKKMQNYNFDCMLKSVHLQGTHENFVKSLKEFNTFNAI